MGQRARAARHWRAVICGRGPGVALPAAVPFDRCWLVSWLVGHDAVVAAAGSGSAGAGAVAAEHLRGGPEALGSGDCRNT